MHTGCVIPGAIQVPIQLPGAERARVRQPRRSQRCSARSTAHGLGERPCARGVVVSAAASSVRWTPPLLGLLWGSLCIAGGSSTTGATSQAPRPSTASWAARATRRSHPVGAEWSPRACGVNFTNAAGRAAVRRPAPLGTPRKPPTPTSNRTRIFCARAGHKTPVPAPMGGSWPASPKWLHRSATSRGNQRAEGGSVPDQLASLIRRSPHGEPDYALLYDVALASYALRGE